ncbi:HAAS signaling domain-containing protein [Actinokineospora sp. HUAS TT18]|uniref:HAAS signaling domain-containing protein n=1 Tax=Actinokineospora sp. HUAS TT18 TaxID=3447451 RepID=UPI003F521850
MNGTTDTRPGLDEYLARVRAALADLPADELAEVLEDIEPHVTEVFGEPGDPVDRLGSPEEYAAELRAAGGYPPVEGPPPVSGHPGRGRFVFWAIGLTSAAALLAGIATEGYQAEPLVVLVLCLPLFVPALWLVLASQVSRSDIADLPEYRRLRAVGDSLKGMIQPGTQDYLRSLRPAWGLIRLVVLAVALLFAIRRGPLVAVFVLALAIGLVWTMGRVDTNRRWLVFTVPANAFVIGMLIGLLFGIVGADRSGPVYYNQGYVGGGLTYGGRPLSNVYAAGPDGKPINEFYLYDETGAPITLDYPSCGGAHDPSVFRNRFPVPRITYVNGYCEERMDLPFVPLPPSPVPSASSTAPSSSTVPSSSVVPSSTSSPTVSVTPTK